MNKLLLLIIPLTIYSQEKGIHFEQDPRWSGILKKAKAENKFIFVHCYTSYCGPSKYMSTMVYPTKQAGDFMNDKFISLKIQLDTTSTDDAPVISGYQTSHEIAGKYNVKASPTYLVFDQDGNPVHRTTGQVRTTGEFIEKIKVSFDPDHQYFGLLQQYKQGKKDSAFLHKLARASIEAYDQAYMQKIINDYINTQHDLYTNENLTLLQYATTTSHDPGFIVMLNDPERVDSVLGKGVAEKRTHDIIISEEIVQKYKDNEPEWKTVTENITKKYPAEAEEIIAKARFLYFKSREDWDKFQFALVDYMKKYEQKCQPEDLNDYAWLLFENCNNVSCLSEALSWSRHSFEDNNQPGYMDTYANLLYKLGKTEAAIGWEIRAMEKSPEKDKKIFEDTIEKMKRGEKLWR